MGLQFKYLNRIDDSKCHVHFSIKPFLQSKEYDLTVKLEDGQAVKIIDGDCINASGWFDWDEVTEENELLELVNELYREEFTK